MFAEIIREALKREYKADEFSPSELGICERRSYFARKAGKVEVVFDNVLDAGTSIHQNIEKYMSLKHGCKAEVEVSGIIEGVKVHGFADLLCDGYLLELKTVNTIYKQPPEYYFYQVSTYYALLRQQGTDIKGVYIIMIDRNTHEVREISVSPETLQEYFEKSKEFIRHVRDALQRGDYSKLQYRTDKLCNYCPFFSTCKQKTLF